MILLALAKRLDWKPLSASFSLCSWYSQSTADVIILSMQEELCFTVTASYMEILTSLWV